MSAIVWEETMSVGVVEIDKQHQKLIKLINDLHVAMLEGKGNDILGDILKEVADYGRVHFTYEEKLFTSAGFELEREHKKLHTEFLEKADKMYNDFKDGRLALTVKTYNFLYDWLSDHIMKEDKKYTKVLNDSGIS
jgi:hemerythrin